MEESIFFNLGNAIASKSDPKELVREAQIANDNRKLPGKMVIVEDEKNGSHILFELNDQEVQSEHTQEFKVRKVID